MNKPNILVVEDEELMRSILRELLEAEGYRVLSADSAENALSIFPNADVAVTLTDIKMAGMDGLELLDRLKTVDEEALVIIMTAYSSVDSAIAALRKGAYDYVTKPFVNEDLLQTVRNAIRTKELFRENRALRRELNRQYSFSDIIGKSASLQNVFRIVEKIADTNASVLIQGESGTGKELMANLIHFNSGRENKPYIKINCGAIPESLLESERFGHEKGAFTDARGQRIGRFEEADGGTLFLDEIGEMSMQAQVRLLRVLQDGEFTRVGGNEVVRTAVRVIAATNVDLLTAADEGKFRKDLYFRLSVFPITLAPLRERVEDIHILVFHFLEQYKEKTGRFVSGISKDALRAMVSYDWPGNVRELENAIERAVIIASGRQIELSDLPDAIAKRALDELSHLRQERARASSEGRFIGLNIELPSSMDEIEKQVIEATLDYTKGDKSTAARLLNIGRRTLYRKLEDYEIKSGDSDQ